MNKPTLLIVDDEPEVLDLLVRTLEGHQFRCVSAPGLQEAKMLVESEDLELVVSDLSLGDGSGLDLLKYIRCIRPSLPVIMITGFPSIQVAEDLLRLGAFDLIEKPFRIDDLVEVVHEALATRQQQLAGIQETLNVIDRPAVFINRRHCVLSVNGRWQQMIGDEGRQTGRHIDEYVGADASLLISDLLAGTASADTVKAELTLVSSDGPLGMELVAVPFRERREQPGGYLITAEPVAGEADDGAPGGGVKLDQLTGCLSHRGFLDALDHLRVSALRRSLPMAILMIDLDDFRYINQTHGYELGDQILQDLANEIRRVFRDEDLAGRYGGDEFVVALFEATSGEACAAANRLCAAAAGLSYDIGGVNLSVGLTVGVTECPAGYTADNRRLLEQAAAAVRWARARHHRGPVVQFRGEMEAEGRQPGVNQEEIDRLTREFSAVNESLKAAYVESAQALVAAVEAKDPYTRRHSESVAYYAEQLSCQLGLPEPLQQSIRYAAVMHDVGKIGIPDQILTKPGPLTPEEYELIKQHPVIGSNIVSHVSCMRREVPFIQHHHENWDGSGYPAGLKGTAIPFGARILRVADSFEAMLSQRSYKKAMEWPDAMAEVSAGVGTLYDPRVVAAMEGLYNNHVLQGAAMAGL